MSDRPAAGALQGLAPLPGAAGRWGWFVALGAIMLVLGCFALGDVAATSLASVVFIGAMMFAGGVVQIVHAIATRRGWRGFLFGLFAGLLYLVTGSFIMREPLQGSVFITLFLLISLVIGGILRIMIALRHRELPGWRLLLIGGLVSVLVGVTLYLALPWSGLWVLGMLIGVELIVQGISWLRFGFGLRGARA